MYKPYLPNMTKMAPSINSKKIKNINVNRILSSSEYINMDKEIANVTNTYFLRDSDKITFTYIFCRKKLQRLLTRKVSNGLFLVPNNWINNLDRSSEFKYSMC